MSLLDEIFTAGVIGAGGAGFPTHKKLVPCDLLIVNAVECEPLLGSDRLVIREFSDEIITALKLISAELSIPEVVIGIKSHYHEEIAALRAALSPGSNIRIFEIDSFYPAGDEQTLIYSITGKTVPPGGIPIALGIVVSNVTTVLNIARAHQNVPVTRRYVTVNGEVGEPVILDVPVGTTPADLIAAAGGLTTRAGVLVRGGPMMGKHAPLSQAGEIGFGTADGGLLVLPADNPVVTLLAKSPQTVVAETRSICIQCRQCTELCPRYLIGHQMRPHRVMRAVQIGTDAEDLFDAMLCCECGICELFSCPLGISPRQMNIIAKNQLRAAGVAGRENWPADVSAVHPEHRRDFPTHKVAQARFIDRLRLGGYPNRVTNTRVFEPDRVRIPLRHGVGKPSTPTVTAGDRVEVGQVIAEVGRDDVGCLVHASVSGRVTGVDEQYISIERRDS
jgi:Na+-translocating ferredoxin:NAD+ oxidoreductase RnfC subunit